MARMISSSGFSRRSRPRISAPMCLPRGTTWKRVRVSTPMAPAPARLAVASPACYSAGSTAGCAAWLLGRLPGVVPRLAVFDFAVGQRGEDLRDQLARGGRAQFHRHAIAPAIGFPDEGDAERAVEGGGEGKVV